MFEAGRAAGPPREAGTVATPVLGAGVRPGSVRDGHRQQLGAFALGQATPDAVGLVDPQGVVPARGHRRALEADRLRLGLAPRPSGASLTLGMEEERTRHAPTGCVQLPVPQVRIRPGKAPGVRHVDPLCSCARRGCRRPIGQVRVDRNRFVGPAVPGIRARTGKAKQTTAERLRAVRSACAVSPLSRIRADLGAVDLQTLDRSRVPDKTLITFFVDLGTGRVIVVGRRDPARPGRANVSRITGPSVCRGIPSGCRK